MEIVKKYFTIGEVAEMLNVNTSTLRFWQDNFNWIDPKRNYKNQRKYKRDSIRNLAVIKILLSIGGMTLEGVNKVKEIDYLEDLKDFYFEKHKDHLIEDQLEYFNLTKSTD